MPRSTKARRRNDSLTEIRQTIKEIQPVLRKLERLCTEAPDCEWNSSLEVFLSGDLDVDGLAFELSRPGSGHQSGAAETRPAPHRVCKRLPVWGEPLDGQDLPTTRAPALNLWVQPQEVDWVDGASWLALPSSDSKAGRRRDAHAQEQGWQHIGAYILSDKNEGRRYMWQPKRAAD